uniref:Uncharacterized protein n=1 Tax=Anopheles coluzzii TaxID=1518534 RepID=A0A8W7PPE9_ANOCL
MKCFTQRVPHSREIGMSPRRKNPRKRDTRAGRMQNTGMGQGGQTTTQRWQACTVKAGTRRRIPGHVRGWHQHDVDGILLRYDAPTLEQRAGAVQHEEDYDAFCLAYMFTYRDFEMGTLGLAWTGDLKNAGGVCEKNGIQFSASRRHSEKIESGKLEAADRKLHQI